jgi:competence protein ComEA
MRAMTGRYRALLFVGYGLLAALVVTGLLLVITRRPAGLPVQLQTPPTPLPLRVHVTGAVVAPGVYNLPPGSIVQDALAAAGGTTPRANLGTLNLAHRLQDGEQVLVPESAPTSAAVSTSGAVSTSQGNSATPDSGNRININTASAAELEALPRVGPALAQRIVDYRVAHGPFRAIEDVMQVSGICPAIFGQIKDLIAVS